MSNTQSDSELNQSCKHLLSEFAPKELELYSSKWNVENVIPDDIKSQITSISSENSNSQLRFVLAFLNIVSLLKQQKRTGWLNFGIDDCESISDHMYRMAIISKLLKTNFLNSKCVEISIVHDLAESLVGDLTPSDPISKKEKHYRELSTIIYLTEKLIKPYHEKASVEFLNLWLEYENQSSIEGKIVKSIDKFEMIIQAFEYEKRYKGKLNLEQFFTAINAIQVEEVRDMADELIKERNEFWLAYK
ncbi:5'-deoxynucleotidase ASCRUDRAFT_6561 [Ascoidea rubescens DSM 1968]|uniref:5'-deoxynucleotidase n=1 Tax=Ascoidea rubescens DSM 1968 TaxID=1344418 RepID=A0A1D2VMU6_9ASCO|nr:hypothetical protein ASCRUDRAFT_6561 [Ascoidea rubescens DSM 1968]ODV62941.1 hypothetical protein ASCRUDRAFT_6561 [Ascoidea rubescens DSM 1968]